MCPWRPFNDGRSFAPRHAWAKAMAGQQQHSHGSSETNSRATQRAQRTYRPSGGVLDVCVGVLLQRREQEAQPALHQLPQRLHTLKTAGESLCRCIVKRQGGDGLMGAGASPGGASLASRDAILQHMFINNGSHCAEPTGPSRMDPNAKVAASRYRQLSAPSIFWMLAVTNGMTSGTMASPATEAHSARHVPAACGGVERRGRRRKGEGALVAVESGGDV